MCPSLTVTDDLFYAQTGLDPNAAQRIVSNSLTGGDDGELYLEYVQSEFFSRSRRCQCFLSSPSFSASTWDFFRYPAR